MSTQVISGARVVLKFSSLILGYCMNVSVTTAINFQPISVLGTLAKVEHVPVDYSVEMSASVSRIASLTRLASVATELGTDTQNAIQGSTGTPTAATPQAPKIMMGYGADGQEILKSGEMEAVIQDVVLNTSIMKVIGIRCSNKSVDFQGGSAIAENLQFVARIAQEFNGSAFI